MARLTVEDVERLASDLASFARAGIPIPDGLRQLESSLSHGSLKKVSGYLAKELESGVSLGDALSRSQVVVPDEFVAIIRCAEKSGDVRSVLDFAADHSRRIYRHRSAVSTTLVYPTFVILALYVSSMLMLVFIVPKFKDIYDQLGAELPMPTQIVIALGDIMVRWGGIIFLLIVVGVLATIFSSNFRNRIYDALGVLPGFRSLAALSDTALFMKFIGRMTARGIPLHDSLSAASAAVWLGRSRDSLRSMAAAAEGGHPVGDLLSGEVPATAAWLFRQAEQRGDLPAACERIADYCEDRFDRLSKRALAVLEPTLLLLVALVVAYVLISMYLPLFNIPKIVGRE